MTQIQQGQLLNVHPLDGGTKMDNVIALQDGSKPIKGYHETEGVININDDYEILNVFPDTFPEFVNQVTDGFKNELGQDLWNELEKEARKQSQEIVEQILDNYFQYLIENFDKVEAAQQAIQDTGLDILLNHGAELASILVQIFLNLL